MPVNLSFTLDQPRTVGEEEKEKRMFTHSPPSKNNAVMITFSDRCIFKLQTMYKGKHKTTTSRTRLGTKTAVMKVLIRRHLWGFTVSFSTHIAVTGWQWSRIPMVAVRPQQMQTMPRPMVTFRNPRVTNSRWYNNKMEILTMTVVIEYVSRQALYV